MASKTRVLLSILAAAAALIGSLAPITLAEELYYTSADEEYMRKQAEKYYTADDSTADYVDPETGEIAWKAVPPELKQHVAQKEKESKQVSLQEDRAKEEEMKKRQETRRSIRSYSSAAAVDWGIPVVVIPGVIVPGTEGTIWGSPKPFTAAQNIAYAVISQGTEIRVALLTGRVDLPEGVIGQLTRPVYNARGEEIFPQATQIFGQYNYYDQAIVWRHILLAGETVKLENPQEFLTPIDLTERTEPGYKLLIYTKKTVLIKIPRM